MKENFEYKRPYYYPFSMNFEEIVQNYPPFDLYKETMFNWPHEKILEIQFTRLQQAIKRAWEIPFYKELWSKAGIECPEDIETMEDFEKIPTFTVYDLRESLLNNPPFGNHIGIEPKDGWEQPILMQTSGGTTGMPRPMLYTALDREIGALVHSRSFALQGHLPGDILQILHGFSTVNAGFITREAVWKYAGITPLTTGTGASTPTKMQVKMAKEWGTTALIGGADYIRHLGETAIDMGIDPMKDLAINKITSYIGRRGRKDIEELFGADVYECYGTHEAVGNIASECQHKSGKHIFEDAYLVEIIDPDSGTKLSQGERGCITFTTLFKNAAPMIRYNVNDISTILPGQCECGSETLRLGLIYGRADNAVKIKGVNVFPESINAILENENRSNKEFICVVEKDEEKFKDKMTVLVEVKDSSVNKAEFQRDLEEEFKVGLGVRVSVSIVKNGELEKLTVPKHASGKKIRLLDKRY